jgi:phage protein D
MSGVRSPRLQVLANGQVLNGAMRAEVVSNNHFAADRFMVMFALPSSGAFGADFWASETSVMLDVRIGFAEQGEWVSLVQGLVDSVEMTLPDGSVRLHGRDLSSRLIEARTQETFSNRTASEIATLLAGRHGLNANVVPTSTLVGRYYQMEHDRLTLDAFSRMTTEWDLLTFLARQEGFDLWVSGTNLNFQPAVQGGVGAVLRPSDLMSLRLDRALTLAGEVEVVVKSWNSRQRSAFVQTARGLGGGGAGDVRRYVFVQPNLTPDAALKMAQRRLADLTLHERVITATMPGELLLSPRGAVEIQGTGTAFDQLYYIDRIERLLDPRSGFTQVLWARNSSVAA